MRVAMYYSNRDVRIEKIPVPKIGPDEILVKTIASGICGSDVMEWYRLKKAPRVLGHEITGEIVETGSEVRNFRKGDRVFVSHHVPCNTCHYCLHGCHTACKTLQSTNYDPGGFAEYIRIPGINVERGVYLLPEEISFEVGTFIEPIACVIRGMGLARLKPGQSVLVMGSGISGLLQIMIARALGAGRILATDINDYRLRQAERFGADHSIKAGNDIRSSVLQHNGARLADLVIVCTGVLKAAEEALMCVDRGGTVLYFAVPEPGIMLPIQINDMWRNEITLMTSYGASPVDIDVAIKLLQSGKITPEDMITHRLPLDETAYGFRLVAEARESIKVIIEPHGKAVISNA